MGLVRGLGTGLGCALALAAVPAGAQAQVQITPQTITVTAGETKAIINRAPIQIRYLDKNGQPALDQVGARPGGYPFIAIDPQPLGSEYIPTPSHYASFQYEVGTEWRKQWPGLFFMGNLLAGKRSGTMHGARSVISATPEGNGVKLVLSTTERYRTLTVRMGPDELSPSSMRVQVSANPSRGVISLGDSFVAGSKEQFYGFGGQHNRLSQRGKALRTWTEAQNLNPGIFKWAANLLLPKTAGEYAFPGGTNGTFYSQALFVSSKGYGFSVNHNNLVRWRMAVDRSERWQVAATGGTLDYTVAAPASPARASGRLTEINGRHPLPPVWAQMPATARLIQSGTDIPTGYRNEFNHRYVRKMREDLAFLEANDTPIKSYQIEEYRHLTKPITDEVIRRLKARGIVPLAYQNSYVEGWEEPVKKGWVVKTKFGRPYLFVSPYVTSMYLLDFTNPEAVTWWKAKITAMLDDGIRGWMQDFAEQVVDDMYFHDGSTGVTMHQTYPILYNKASREAINEWKARNPGEGVWVYNRAGSSGRPGTAAYEDSNFLGDATTDWSKVSGLPSQTIDMLSRGLGGAYGASTDHGGYADFLAPRTSAQLFTRWVQWSVFSPFFRSHHSSIQGMRQPWQFGTETYERYVKAAKLHNRAIPLIRAEWQKALDGEGPPIKPLWMVAPDEPGAVAEQQAWMIGNDLLAAPVVIRGAVVKEVYLPRGCWNYGPTGQEYTGGQKVTVPADISTTPYFTRCGTTPLAPETE